MRALVAAGSLWFVRTISHTHHHAPHTVRWFRRLRPKAPNNLPFVTSAAATRNGNTATINHPLPNHSELAELQYRKDIA